MPILSPSDAGRVREMLADLPNPVRLVFFTQTLNCETCEPTKQILGELAGLSDRSPSRNTTSCSKGTWRRLRHRPRAFHRRCGREGLRDPLPRDPVGL